MTGWPVIDCSDSCLPGWPSTPRVKFFAGPRFCGVGTPEPTVAPTTMSATAAAATAEAATTRRVLRSARTLPRQPGIGVTAPPWSSVPRPARRVRRTRRPGGCPRQARRTAPPARRPACRAGPRPAPPPRAPAPAAGAPAAPARTRCPRPGRCAPAPRRRARGRPPAPGRGPGPAELGTRPEPVEDPVQLGGEDPLTAVRDDHTSGLAVAVADHLEPDLL